MGLAWLRTLGARWKFSIFLKNTFLRNCPVWDIIVVYVKEL